MFFTELAPFDGEFFKTKGMERKTFLVIDNSPFHLNKKELECSEIRVIFLPSSVTLLGHPMDKGVSQVLKKK
jgi:hypothetical protein